MKNKTIALLLILAAFTLNMLIPGDVGAITIKEEEELSREFLKVVLSRYEKAYGEYQAMWNEILSKHFNIDLSKGSYSWHCNFSTGEVVVTDNG